MNKSVIALLLGYIVLAVLVIVWMNIITAYQTELLLYRLCWAWAGILSIGVFAASYSWFNKRASFEGTLSGSVLVTLLVAGLTYAILNYLLKWTIVY